MMRVARDPVRRGIAGFTLFLCMAPGIFMRRLRDSSYVGSTNIRTTIMLFLPQSILEPSGFVAAGFVAGSAISVAWRRRSRPVASASNISHRPRTGRLPLPEGVTKLAGDESLALRRVNDFADDLAATSLTDWLAIGADLQRDSAHDAERASARERVEAAIRDSGLDVAGWYARDAIETAAFFAWNRSRQPRGAERARLARAHGAAELAALALLAWPTLSADDVALLCHPFASIIPAGAAL